MSYQPTFEQMEDKQVVRGLEYNEGEWTGGYFQPVLLCTHRRAELRQEGWILEESGSWFHGEGIHRRNERVIDQKCEHAKA